MREREGLVVVGEEERGGREGEGERERERELVVVGDLVVVGEAGVLVVVVAHPHADGVAARPRGQHDAAHLRASCARACACARACVRAFCARARVRVDSTTPHAYARPVQGAGKGMGWGAGLCARLPSNGQIGMRWCDRARRAPESARKEGDTLW